MKRRKLLKLVAGTIAGLTVRKAVDVPATSTEGVVIDTPQPQPEPQPPPSQTNNDFASLIDVGLFTKVPPDGIEVVGGGYTRQPFGDVIGFPTSVGDWGQVIGWGLFDHNTGRLLYHNSFTSSIHMLCGDSIELFWIPNV